MKELGGRGGGGDGGGTSTIASYTIRNIAMRMEGGRSDTRSRLVADFGIDGD